MTEPEWLACQKLSPMMAFLRRHPNNRAFRLAGCAAVRLVWDHVVEKVGRQCVDTSERFADGEASPAELVRVHRRADANTLARMPVPGPRRTRADRDYAAMRAAVYSATVGSYAAAFSAMQEAALAGKRGDLGARQCELLRDIFRPFRPIAFDAKDVGHAVARLAQAAYAERDAAHGWLDPGRLAVLADALEESGCTAAELLDHLRKPEGHVRGCWALDLVLEKR